MNDTAEWVRILECELEGVVGDILMRVLELRANVGRAGGFKSNLWTLRARSGR